eukprot:m.77077 g.77077  ORF g.77077 m.77077 type:complete len:276 (+) comp14449_c0_seq1:288-1115(+)
MLANYQCGLLLLSPIAAFANDDFNGTFGVIPDDDRTNQQSQSDSNSDNSTSAANPYAIAAFCMVGGIVLLIALMAFLSRRSSRRQNEEKERQLAREEDAAIEAIYHHQPPAARPESSLWLLPKERDSGTVPAITVDDAARLHTLAQLKEEEMSWDWEQSIGAASLRLHQYDCAVRSRGTSLGYMDLSDRAQATMAAVRNVEAGLAEMANSEVSESLVSVTSGDRSMSLDHALSVSVVDLDAGGLSEPSGDDSLQYRAWLTALRAASESEELADDD